MKWENIEHTWKVFVDLVMGRVLKPKLDLAGCGTYVEGMGVWFGSEQEHIDNVINTE